MEHMGLRSVRNLEVLDLSGNKIRRIATNPLRNLDWLVELKMDDNHICKVQGEPFSSMPRLKVLTMRNNRMVSVTEPTFRHLRGNLAVLELDGWFDALHDFYSYTNFQIDNIFFIVFVQAIHWSVAVMYCGCVLGSKKPIPIQVHGVEMAIY